MELLRRKDVLKAKGLKQVKQMAHVVKDKLAKTVAKLQSRLMELDQILTLKMQTIKLALSA